MRGEGLAVQFSKRLKFISFSILACLLLVSGGVFFRPIAKTALGIAAKLILRLGSECHFAYRAIEWKERRLVFSDVVLLDLSGERCSYQMHAEKVELTLDWSRFPRKLKGHLAVERPSVSLFDPFHFRGAGEGWLSLTAAVRDGMVEWMGVERARFNFAKAAPTQIGRLEIEWGGAAMALEAFEEGAAGLRVDGELKSVPVRILKELAAFYCPSLEEKVALKQGFLQGAFHLQFDGGVLRSAAVNLETEGAAFDCAGWKVDGLDGRFDWEGPLERGGKIGLLKDFSIDGWNGRCRAAVAKVQVILPGGIGVSAAGSFGFTPGMGAKWDLAGEGKREGKTHPFHLQGRGYFHSQMPNWIETEIGFGSSRIHLHGKEGDGRRNWTGRCANLTADEIGFLQAAGMDFAPEWFLWGCSGGVYNCEGSIAFSDEKIESWVLSEIDAKNAILEWEGIRFSCAEVEGSVGVEGGKIDLAEGAFCLPLLDGKKLEGKGWSGQAVLNEGLLDPSHFSGWIEGIQAAAEISGTLRQWKARAQTAGNVSGSLLLSGKYEDGRLDAQIEKGILEGILFCGKGWIDREKNFSLEIERFLGQIGSLEKIWPEWSFGGTVRHLESGLRIEGTPEAWDWKLDARIEMGTIYKYANFRLENLFFDFTADTDGFSCLGIEGEWAAPQGRAAMHCPVLSRKGKEWLFDLRVETGAWDLLRLVGSSDEQEIFFNTEKCRLLGNPLTIGACALTPEMELDRVMVRTQMPWKSILAAGPFLESLGLESWVKKPLSGSAEFYGLYQRGGGSEIAVKGVGIEWKSQPFPLEFHAVERSGEWTVDVCRFDQMDLTCAIRPEGEGVRVLRGSAGWESVFHTEFEGKISPSLRCEMRLSDASVSLKGLVPLASLYGMPLEGLEGSLAGSGHLIWERGVEIDLDFTASGLRAGALQLENQGPIHLLYSSDRGITFRGIDLHAAKEGLEGASIDCRVDLLHYDAFRSYWVFSRSHVHLPVDVLHLLPSRPPFLDSLGLHQELDFIADIECATDFSHLSCSMKEGFIPFYGTVRHIQDLYCVLDNGDFTFQFQTFHQGRLIRAGGSMDLQPKIEGRLILEDLECSLQEGELPLTIDWIYDGGQFGIRTIEGSFGGVEASFHAEEENRLIGSARIHFGTLSEFLPPSAAEVFKELEMGKGYELKGRLFLGKEGIRFKGLLSGKQLELFGYQFRTLLAQVDLGPEKMRIYDLKISDTAGILKCDEILLEAPGTQPWMIEIPALSIQELRPSLLQKPDAQMGEISPLVVRELKMTDFKGLLDEGKTWTAKGELSFINSYKREHTVLDIPADVLGRIVGLDLELLIPVKGFLTFDLKDGFFRLVELKESFSESNRSQFFLVTEGDSPSMDLDGNLKILVKMKQFVLFKFTEAFLISIEGKLNDPKFHLQKKKRFLGM